MSLIRVQVSIPTDTALPEDAITNTWLFGTAPADVSAPTLDAIQVALVDFYTQDENAAELTSSVSGFLSAALDPAHARFKFYDLGDAEPRTPLRNVQIALDAPGSNTSNPAEVAMCFSFQAVPVSGVNQARRRGRVFLGPLNNTAFNGGIPSDGMMHVLQKAGDRLIDASDASALWSWVIQNGLDGDSPMTTAIVDNGWVDNAFDTQRRRGIKPTVRLTFDGS